MQESWLAIVRGLRRLNDPAAFPAWAYRIVTNQSALWIRRQQHHRRRSRSLSSVPEPAADEAVSESTDAVRHAVGRLPSADRAVLDLRYRQGLSIGEIARASNVPAGTVKSRLHAARARLREHLSPDSS